MALRGARSKTVVAALEVARPAPTTRGTNAWPRDRAAPCASRIRYMALGRLASTTAGRALTGTKASRQRVLSRKVAENLLWRSKSRAKQVRFANLTLGEKQDRQRGRWRPRTPKGSALRFGFVFLMGAAVVLMLTRCIRIAIRIHGCACSAFAFGHVSRRVFGFGRCK